MEQLPNYQQHHMIDLLTTLRTGKEADVLLVCGDREYPVHKVILKISSPYFVAMFNSGLEECKSGKVNFSQMEPETLEAVLDFVYFGQMVSTTSRQELERILEASHLMQLNKLFVYCCEALLKLLSPDYFMQLLTIAQKYEKNEMVQVILDYLVANYETVFASNSYMLATYDQVKCLILYLSGKTPCEDNVLKGILNWLMHDLNLRTKFVNLLESIDPTRLSKTFVTKLLANKEVMSSPVVISSKIKEISMTVLTSDSYLTCPIVRNVDKECRKIIFFSDCCDEICYDERNATSTVRNNFEVLHQNPCRNVTNFSSSRRYVNCIQQYDLQTSNWLPVGFLVFGGFKGVAMCQYGQHIYMVGGPMGSNCNKCDVNGQLIEIFNTNLPRTMDAGMCAFQGHLFLIGGGLNTKNESLETVYCSTTDQSIWCEDSQLQTPRTSPSVMASSVHMYVAGGSYTEKFSWPTVEYTRIVRESSNKLEPWTLINFPQTPAAIHSVVIKDKLHALYSVKQNLVIMKYETESCKWIVKTFPIPPRDGASQQLGLSHVFQFPDDQSNHVFVSSTFNHDIPNFTIELETGHWNELVMPQGVCGLSGAVRLCTVGI